MVLEPCVRVLATQMRAELAASDRIGNTLAQQAAK